MNRKEPRGQRPGHSASRGCCSRGNRAVGIQYPTRRGATHQVGAGGVILSGGAINSPPLLQLSGVGNATELGALGVEVVHDLAGVGEHLQDHLEVYIQYACTQPVSMQPSATQK